MQIIFEPREGYMETCEPVDTTSSKTKVYLRKNIRRETREDDQGTVEFWAYDEAVLTPEEYEQFREIKEIVDAVKEEDDTKKILDALLGGEE